MKHLTQKRKDTDPVLFLDEVAVGPIDAAEKLAGERMKEVAEQHNIPVVEAKVNSFVKPEDVSGFPQPTQKQMFYEASKNASACDMLFLEFVEEGLTKQELQTNIDRRPALWGKYANWLDTLPSEPQVGDDVTIIRKDDDLGLEQEVNVIGKALGMFVVEGSDGEKFEVNIHEVQQ